MLDELEEVIEELKNVRKELQSFNMKFMAYHMDIKLLLEAVIGDKKEE